MAKPKQPPLPSPPSSSSSSSSSSSDDSPPPAISTIKKPAPFSTTTVLQKPPNPFSNSIVQPQEEEQKENSETEDGSTEEESSDNSDHAAAKSNPPPHPTDSRTESEDGEEDSSSESEQQPLPPPPQAAVKVEKNKSATEIDASDSASEDESENSSDSDTIIPPPPPRISPRNTADPSLKPLNSKPMDSAVQLPDKSPVSKKRSVNNPAEISEKKRKIVHVVKAEGGQEKKEITRKIWSKSDELVLLQCVFDFIEQHHETSTPAQVESLLKSQAEALLKSVNDSLPSSVTLTQMNDKIRRLRQKFNATVKKVKDVSNPNISNAHDAAVFELSRKIWGSGKKEPVLTENKFKSDKLKENIKEEKGKANVFAVEYPFLRWHAKNDDVKSALVVQSRIPTREAEELEGSCKKLEITEVQLHMKKMKLLSSSLKLIEDALAKL